MRSVWCLLLVVQVLAMRAATMPQGPRVPHHSQAQQIIFGSHSDSHRPGFGPHPSAASPFFAPNVPNPGSAFDPNLNGQRLSFPFNFGAQPPPAFQTNLPVFTPDLAAPRDDFGSGNQINFPDASAAGPPPTPSTPKPATGTNPLDTRILINAPCRGHCMTKRSGRCELDATCLFG